MKAKRIAELKNTLAIARMNHDFATAAVICAELSAVIASVEKPCSDQLRAELTANNIEMNRLTERNDAILSTLRGRGLDPVRVRDDVKCKVRFVVDKPLTNEQLRAGDWYCREVSADVTQLLIDKEISYCIFSGPDGARVVKFAVPLNSEPSKEIIRKGNEFYYV